MNIFILKIQIKKHIFNKFFLKKTTVSLLFSYKKTFKK